MRDDFLATIDCHRRLAGNFGGGGHYRLQHRILIGVNRIDQTHRFGFVGTHPAAGIGQFPGNTFGNELDDARKGADVSGHADVGFKNREERIGGGITHATSRGQIDAGANAAPLNGGQYGNSALLERGEAFLHHPDPIVEIGAVLNATLALAFGRVVSRVLAVLAEHVDIDAAGEMRSR